MIKFEDYVSLNGKPTPSDRARKSASPIELIEKLMKKKSRQERIQLLIDALSSSPETDKNFWMKTDPKNPPFKIGQEVWIKSEMRPFLNHDDMHLLASPQIVKKMTPIPCVEVNLWAITFKGCNLIITNQDVDAV